MSRYCGVHKETQYALCLAHSRHIISDKQTRQMSRSAAQARQNPCLALSRSVLALKIAFWPESGAILAQSGHKFSYGNTCTIWTFCFLVFYSTLGTKSLQLISNFSFMQLINFVVDYKILFKINKLYCSAL